ncbi:MAG: sugar ABC transporter permease [Pseudomonadota bacterium]|nr:sugar ABC transporter permease [Pseudomonadota bacterium]
MAQTQISRREFWSGWLFSSPALALLTLFLLYPILSSLWMSFQIGKGMNLSFGGFANINRLTQDPVFLHALTNTLTFLIIQVPIMIALALLLAVSLNDSKLWGRSLFRTALFLPCVTSLVAYSVLFKSMFAVDGVVNGFLETLHIISQPIPWLADAFWAKILIILAITWRWTGYNMIFFLASLQNIDPSIYEAARIDGIPRWAQFVKITLPALKPVILFTTVTSTIGTLQLFDEVNNITSLGGPSDATLTLSLYIYYLSFRFVPSFGYAATVSYVIVVLVMILSFLQFLFARDRRRT